MRKGGVVAQPAGHRILVVDDESSIVDSVATVLRYEGFNVDVASTGRSALAKAQESRHDLLVLDVMLPDLDGLDVTRRLRADNIDVPVLFLTAKSDVEDRVAGLSVGGDDYVAKGICGTASADDRLCYVPKSRSPKSPSPGTM